jgi:methylthioribose-1-phosphate isomerase
VAHAIKSMQVRGAPLIGVTAAYGVALAMRADASDANLDHAVRFLGEQRPTAVNLRWALEDLRATLGPVASNARAAAAYARAAELAEEDVETCRRMGVNGAALIKEIAERKAGHPVNVLTHCNAGWLACVDGGTATSSIYQAHDAGIPVHVWVDETRPRNQGAALTAFELLQHGVPHSLIADNAGGHFMQRGDVDLVIVGTDRVTANGDVANKIGTYLKALAAKDNGVPFYVGLPYSTIDWRTENGSDIPIEERSEDELLRVQGRLANGDVASVFISANGTHGRNPAFDVTPARLVTGFITERGVCAASREGLLSLYPEKTSAAA